MQGLNGFEPNVEAIAALDPDLVLTDGTNPDFLAQLDTLGIAHWEGPAAVEFADIYAEIEQLGAATGKVGEAAELVAQMQTDIDGCGRRRSRSSTSPDLLPRAVVGLLLGHERHVHRPRLRAARPGEHRRRGG